MNDGDKSQKPDEEANWQFHAGGASPAQPQQTVQSAQQQQTVPADVPPSAPEDPAQFMPPVTGTHHVEWTASEYVAHEKGLMWYVALLGGVVALTVVVYLLTKDLIAVVMIGLVAILFAILAARKPRVLHYEVGPQGVSIGGKMYPYADFKSFGVVTQGAFSSIVLMPLKRLMPALSVYYPPEEEQKIVEALSDYLPFAPVTPDFIDRTMFRIRF